MQISETSIAKIAEQVIAIYQTLGFPEGPPLPVVTRIDHVHDDLTGRIFAIHQIGLTLEAIGGVPLVSRVIHYAEARLDDVQVAVFLNRRWDGHPRQ